MFDNNKITKSRKNFKNYRRKRTMCVCTIMYTPVSKSVSKMPVHFLGLNSPTLLNLLLWEETSNFPLAWVTIAFQLHCLARFSSSYLEWWWWSLVEFSELEELELVVLFGGFRPNRSMATELRTDLSISSRFGWNLDISSRDRCSSSFTSDNLLSSSCESLWEDFNGVVPSRLVPRSPRGSCIPGAGPKNWFRKTKITNTWPWH